MRLGVNCFLTDRSIGIAEMARAAESRGFTELWLPEHTHIPTGRETAWPMEPEAELPEQYRRSHDPFVALAAAAAATTTLDIGTGVCLITQHDPITLAKTVSTLDHVSNGRLILGVGFGWNVDEMRHHGVDPDRRRAIGREKTLAMKELWTNEVASFSGQHVEFGPSWQWPKPVQRPHPPIWIGGGKATIPHVVEWADGWMPVEGAVPVSKLVRTLRSMADDAGRDPETLSVYVVGVGRNPARIEAYHEAGIIGVSMDVRADTGRDAVLRELDENMEFGERYVLD
ncbi:MAG: LLM class F420-dependent oxidoreductase [Ilumatobacteraceae bacterium]|nr:LLM class F420-dependent oxidoreductase [Ilumatobacteraceae bacterium]